MISLRLAYDSTQLKSTKNRPVVVSRQVLKISEFSTTSWVELNRIGQCDHGYDWKQLVVTLRCRRKVPCLFWRINIWRNIFNFLFRLYTRENFKNWITTDYRLISWVESDRAVWSQLRCDSTELDKQPKFEKCSELLENARNDQLSWVELRRSHNHTARSDWVELSWVGSGSEIVALANSHRYIVTTGTLYRPGTFHWTGGHTTVGLWFRMYRWT